MKNFEKRSLHSLTLAAVCFASADAHAIDYTLAFNTWEMIALPDTLQSGESTPEELFGVQLKQEDPLATYTRDWTMFSYDSGTGEYTEPDENEPLDSSSGYWIIQRVAPNVTLRSSTALDPSLASGLCNVFKATNTPPPDELGCTESSSKIVFATNQTIRGADITSLGNADSMCQAEAGEAGLDGHFMAWLGMDTSSVTERFSFSPGDSYSVPSGRLVIDDINTLKGPRNAGSSVLASPINENAFGNTLTTTLTAWSGTNAIGGAVGADCLEWAGDRIGFTRYTAAYGSLTRTTTEWITGNNTNQGFCDLEKRLYCFQQ